jgi:hypothetical protein
MSGKPAMGPSPFKARRLRGSHLRVTARGMAPAAIMMPWPGNLLAAARLSWAAIASPTTLSHD